MINTTLLYIQRDHQYLMLHRTKKENDLNRDKWVGIGGKFEDGESPEDCVKRETLEETGLTLTQYRYRGLVTLFRTDGPPNTCICLPPPALPAPSAPATRAI